MSLKQFKTDATLEKKGIILDYGDYKITIARAGGQNKKFAKLLEAKTKPYRRAMQTGTMDNDVAENLLKEVYAEAVFMDWETKVGDKFEKGIEDIFTDNKKLLPFSKENVLKVINELPELFADVQAQASNYALFREEVREEEAKN